MCIRSCILAHLRLPDVAAACSLAPHKHASKEEEIQAASLHGASDRPNKNIAGESDIAAILD